MIRAALLKLATAKADQGQLGQLVARHQDETQTALTALCNDTLGTRVRSRPVPFLPPNGVAAGSCPDGAVAVLCPDARLDREQSAVALIPEWVWRHVLSYMTWV